jgi:hypothetical protein
MENLRSITIARQDFSLNFPDKTGNSGEMGRPKGLSGFGACFSTGKSAHDFLPIWECTFWKPAPVYGIRHFSRMDNSNLW